MRSKKLLDLFISLSAANNTVSKTLDRHLGAVNGVGVSEFRVLHELQAAPSHTLSRIALAEQIGLTASGITRLLNPMEKIGLVEKQSNERDARVSLVKLTNTGGKRFDEALSSFNFVMQQSTENLDDTERDTLISLLRKLS